MQLKATVCVKGLLLEDLIALKDSNKGLTISWRRSLSYRNQSIDLLYKSIDWSLYDRDLRHKRVNRIETHSVTNVLIKLLSILLNWIDLKKIEYYFLLFCGSLFYSSERKEDIKKLDNILKVAFFLFVTNREWLRKKFWLFSAH